jgi:hypothetical protein
MISFFVNGFLICFLLDGVAFALATMVSGFPLITTARLWLANVAWFFAFVLYLLMAFAPRLPKRVLLPPIIFLPISLVAAMPLPLYVGLERAMVILAWAQVALGIFAFLLIRLTTRPRRWLFTAAAMEGPAISLGHILRFVAINALMIPLVIFYCAFCVAQTINHYSAGFLHLGIRGLQTEEREYVRGNKRVTLIGMVHIANAKFYQEVRASIQKPGTVLLSEGVSDTNHVLRTFHSGSYKKLAKAVGLVEQDRAVVPNISVLRADVDCSEFSKTTVLVLNTVGSSLQKIDTGNATRLWASLIRNFLFEQPVELEWKDMEVLYRDVVQNRNACCLSRIETAVKNHDRVVIPWGAMHMPGLEKGVLEKGFVLASRKKCSVVRW